MLCCYGELLFAREDYFQQQVAYDITVTLDDSAHTLSAHEKIEYTNNSPHALEFIYFHLWPNAYKNHETAFAKQKERFLSTSFLFSKEKDRGYIDSLNFSIDGVETNWEYHPDWIDVAKVQLPNPLLPGQTITIETPFFLKIPKVFSRLGHSGKHYEMTQWYPKPAVYDHKGWHPMPYLDMGEFYSEFGSFDVKITLPENYRVMATGDLVNGEAEYAWLDSLANAGDSLHALPENEFKETVKALKKGKKKSIWQKVITLFKKEEKADKQETKLKTLHFHQDKVHDFAWFADPNWIVRKGTLYLADSTREVTLWSMYLPKNAELWENSIEYLHDSGYWYSEFIGDYPYNHITAVDGDLSAGGGMEYPNITVISTTKSKHRLENVIMHEVGHNWFYGILGTNERDHVWMDEGLNEFNNIRYWDKKYGAEGRKYILNEKTQQKLGPFSVAKNLKYGFMEYVGYTSWIKLGDEEPLETSSNSFKRRTNYWLSYSKPFVYSWHLLHYLGEDTIDTILQDFYEDWKFKHPYPEDFFAYFPKHTDKDYSWYTKDVFYKTGLVDYSVKLKKDKVIFKNKGTLTVPFQAAFYDKAGSEIQRSWVEGVNKFKTIELPANTKSVIIDPDETLPDVNRPNNATHKPFKLSWVFDQPHYYKREVFWLPWLFSHNQFNGFTPGVKLYHGFIPGYDYGVGVTPLWDFHNEQLVGHVSFSRYLYDFGEYYQSSFSGNLSRFEGRSGLQLNFKGKRKEKLQRYPVWTTSAALDFHSINGDAVDSSYYTSGELGTAYGELSFYHRPNPQTSYTVRSGLKTGFLNAEFVRLHVQLNYRYKFSKKFMTKLRIWTGGFLTSTNLPKQYITYLSGGIDPDFRQSFVINRTAETNNASIGTRQFITQGPSVHGMILQHEKLSGVSDWVLSGNVEMTVPKLPGTPFADAAIVFGGETYFDIGWKYSLGPFSVIIPLYQSWDATPLVNSTDWLSERIRFSITVKSFNYRDIF